eukprot:597606-Pyramimonas_sp.AAC.1
MEEDSTQHNSPLAFTRLLHEGLFVRIVFAFYNGVSPCQALRGRQPACLPDPPGLHRQSGAEAPEDSFTEH